MSLLLLHDLADLGNAAGPFALELLRSSRFSARGAGQSVVLVGVGDPSPGFRRTDPDLAEWLRDAVRAEDCAWVRLSPLSRPARIDLCASSLAAGMAPAESIGRALHDAFEGDLHLSDACFRGLIRDAGREEGPAWHLSPGSLHGYSLLDGQGVQNGFLPIYEDIPEDVLKKAKLLFVNYPNNPTGACADDSFYEKTLELAKKYDILICHDAAYSEIAYDGYRPKSILEFDRDKKYSLEFHSLSKTYCMTGWRIGFAVGNADGIYNLGKLKTNIDSGAFQAVQYAGMEALNGPQVSVGTMLKAFQERRDTIVDGLNAIPGFRALKPRGAFYARRE